MIDIIFDSTIFNEKLLGNSIADYIDAFLYFIIALVVLFIMQKLIVGQFNQFAKKTVTEVDDILVEFVQSIRPRLYIVFAAYVAFYTLNISNTLQSILNVIVIVVVIFQITRSLQILIEFTAKKVSGADEDEHVQSAAHLLSGIMIIVVWVFGVMMILSNIGINITSLVAGVGITGVAIAFAVKEVLADLLSSFSIYFDKPFKAGDIVKIDKEVGTVKKIGIKTTRIESSTGEELIVSNQDMTSSRVHNYKQMQQRNVRIKFSVSFDTPVDVLKSIPVDVQNIIDTVDHAQCKRVHFKEFGDWGLIFDALYTIDSRNFEVYMDARQAVNLGIKDLFDTKGIEFAYATKMEIPNKKQ